MTYTGIELPYGDTVLKARVPAANLAYVLATRDVPGLADEPASVTAALRRPAGRPPLRDCVGEGDKVVVIVTDNTRPCPDDRLLPPVLAELETKVRREDITIIVALGLHPPMTRDELVKKLGKEIVAGYEVVNHDINDTVNIGTTARGTPVDINRRVVAADFRLSTGFIEPHFFAGFSGGRKSIAPGVFGARSAYHNHGYPMIAHPKARAGVLEGNPVHEDMVEQARMAKLDFIVNVLLNKRREITHVFAGDAVAAHERGCAVAWGIVGAAFDRQVDIAITTNNGAPLDMDLYQTVKGIDTAARITREGGVIIVASACSTCVGPESFLELHASASSPAEVLARLERREPVGVPWENQILARIQMQHDVYLVSCLADDAVRRMMITPVPGVEAGLEKALQKLGGGASIGVIPEGPLVLPVSGEAA